MTADEALVLVVAAARSMCDEMRIARNAPPKVLAAYDQMLAALRSLDSAEDIADDNYFGPNAR